MSNTKSLRLRTQTPLQAGETFTSNWEDLTSFSSITISCYADQECLIYVDESVVDPSTVGPIRNTASSHKAKVNANSLMTHTVCVHAPFYRIRIENTSGQNMTALQCETLTFATYQNPPQRFLPPVAQTEANILNGGTFDSGIFDINGYERIEIELFSNQNVTFNGFWYSDPEGNNLIRNFSIPYTTDLQLLKNTAATLGRYLRITIVNSSGAEATQVSFRLILSNIAQTGNTSRLDQFLPPNIAAQVTRSVTVGIDTNGVYNNLRVNEFGALQSVPFFLDAARGFFPEIKYNKKFGRNSNIDTGTANGNGSFEDVWNGGNLYTGQPVSGTATTLEIASDNANDTAAGTGARTVLIQGLDADYNEIEETIILNGTSAVTTVNSYWRQSKAKVLTAGSAGWNIGEITSHWTGTPAQIFMVMPARANQTAICCDTVPAGKIRIIYGLSAEMARANGSAGSANVRFLTRRENQVFRTDINAEITNSLKYESLPDTYIVIPEKTDLKWSVDEVSDNNTIVTAEFVYLDITED